MIELIERVIRLNVGLNVMKNALTKYTMMFFRGWIFVLSIFDCEKKIDQITFKGSVTKIILLALYSQMIGICATIIAPFFV